MGATLENLRSWKPGQSGNPSGRPKRSLITDHLAEQLGSPIPESMKAQIPEDMLGMFGPNPTFGQFAAFKLLSVAIGKGDVLAFKEILERVEGKVVQKAEVDVKTTLETLILGEPNDSEQ